MVKLLEDDLDATFAALSHAVRRATLDALGRGPASVSELAAPHGMTLAAFMKHLRSLESAKLIRCEKQGRTVFCALHADPLKSLSHWMTSRESLWNARFGALARHLYHLEETSSPSTRKGKKG
jgi:DNA-binding transcriptional ArsR family regulator